MRSYCFILLNVAMVIMTSMMTSGNLDDDCNLGDDGDDCNSHVRGTQFKHSCP